MTTNKMAIITGTWRQQDLDMTGLLREGWA